MNNRWCIIAGARTGSRYLEDLIFNALPRTQAAPAIKLGEFLSEDFIMYKDSTGVDIFEKQDILSAQRCQYMTNVLDKIERDNNASVVLRIFVQPHLISTKTPLASVSEILQKFKNLNFNFVFLQRNIFERAISALVAHKTNKWARHYGDESIWGSMRIDPHRFINTIEYIKTQIQITKNLLEHTSKSYSLVNYENLIEDCLLNNIPLGTMTSNLVKTYDVPYKQIILNYDELVSIYENLDNQ